MDPKKKVVNQFIDQLLYLDSINRRKIEFHGVFMNRENRKRVAERLKNKNVEIVLFNP